VSLSAALRLPMSCRLGLLLVLPAAVLDKTHANWETRLHRLLLSSCVLPESTLLNGEEYHQIYRIKYYSHNQTNKNIREE
jgi:hypothetical protein